MSRRIGILSENRGQGSRHSNVKDHENSLHVVGCVSTYKKKENASCLTAYLESERQYFEEVEQQEDETQYLKAENQKRTEEMLQKAKEELYKRKEKCSDEDPSKNKEEMVPDTKQHHQLNELEMLHKMMWLRNQNNNNVLESSHKARETRNMVVKEIVPHKREETDEYFSCMKQSKSKGRRKNRTETIISLEDLKKPLLEAAACQKNKFAQSHHKSASVLTQQESVRLSPPPPEMTCWQQKAGVELFPDVPTQKFTVYGAKVSDDELLKIAIEESWKTHEAENHFIYLNKGDCTDHTHPNTCNSVGVMQLPVLEPIEEASWDDADRMGPVGNLSPPEDKSVTAAGQMQDSIGSSTKHEDWEMGASQATSIVDEPAVKCQTIGRNQNWSDSSESLSSNKECNITSVDIGQYRSQHRVENDAYNNNGNLNHSVKSEYEENIWDSLETDETSPSQKNGNQHPIKELNQNWKNPVPDPNIHFGDRKALHHMSKGSDSRYQEQVDWSQNKSQVKNQKGAHDQNCVEPVPCSQTKRTVSHSYVPEGSDSRSRGRVDRNPKKDQIEKQKCDHAQNLRELMHGPQRNKRESKTQGYIPQASDNVTQGIVDWNQKRSEIENLEGNGDQNLRGFVPESQEKVFWNPEKNLIGSQKVSSYHNYVSLGVVRGKSLKEIQHQECFDFGNQDYIDRRPLYCSDEERETKKDNELDREKSQGDSWVGSKVQRHGPVSQGAGICWTEETSLGRDEGEGMPEKRMSEQFACKKSEVSSEYICPNYDSKVQIHFGVCGDEPKLSYDENCSSEIPVEQLNFDPTAVQDSPEAVQMSATHTCDTHPPQFTNQFVRSPACTSQFQSVAGPLFPPMNPMAAVLPSTGSLPVKMDISLQPYAQQIPDQAFQPSSHPLPTTDIQKLFEAFVQEQQQRMMNMNYLVQMAVMNSGGLPNTNPDLKMQTQQSDLTPMMNSPRGLPTHYDSLLLQSNNALLNPSMAPMLNPSLLAVNQIVAPRNVPLQSEACSFNRERSTVLMPNPYVNMNNAVNISLDDMSFMLSNRNQANNSNVFMNNAVSASLNDSALHMNQTNNPLLMPSFAVGHDHLMHSNYQSTQTQQPAAGNIQNIMQHVSPDVYSQPFGSRATSIAPSSRRVIGKGRGRLIT